MLYKGFIDCLRNAETARVKSLSIPNSCALTQVPCAFQILLPNIVRLIEQNLEQLCQPDQAVAWFGLQVTSGGIQSTLPEQLNRSHYFHYPDVHFCCVLSYLIVGPDFCSANPNWQHYRSLVIDFTSGYLMDNQHYIFLMLGEGSPGCVYGQLEQKLLKKAWVLANKEKRIATAPQQGASANLMEGFSTCGIQL